MHLSVHRVREVFLRDASAVAYALDAYLRARDLCFRDFYTNHMLTRRGFFFSLGREIVSGPGFFMTAVIWV